MTLVLQRLESFAAALRQGDYISGFPQPFQALYRKMALANFQSCLADAFPQSQALLEPASFANLIDEFFAHGQCPSPSFHQLPAAFLEYLVQNQSNFSLPAQLMASLHWELTLLELSFAPLPSPPETDLDPWQEPLEISSSAALRHYPYAVHLLPATVKARDCYLIAYLDDQGIVRFAEMDLAEARLGAAIGIGETGAASYALAFPGQEQSAQWCRKCLEHWLACGILRRKNET